MDVEELNNERKRQKLSVAELAEKANLPKGTVEKVLFGIVKHPRIDTMQAIERALGLNEKSPTNNGEANIDLNIPEKYSGIRVALNEGDKNLTQDDIDDIVRFIEFTANKNRK